MIQNLMNERLKEKELLELHRNVIILLNDYYTGEDDLEKQCKYPLL